MASTPEGRITAQIKKYLENLQVGKLHIFYVKIHGGPHQLSGIPDWHVLWDGRAYYIEIKAPGKKASKIQQHRMNQIAYAGGVVGVATSLAEFKQLLED